MDVSRVYPLRHGVSRRGHTLGDADRAGFDHDTHDDGDYRVRRQHHALRRGERVRLAEHWLTRPNQVGGWVNPWWPSNAADKDDPALIYTFSSTVDLSGTRSHAEGPG